MEVVPVQPHVQAQSRGVLQIRDVTCSVRKPLVVHSRLGLTAMDLPSRVCVTALLAANGNPSPEVIARQRMRVINQLKRTAQMLVANGRRPALMVFAAPSPVVSLEKANAEIHRMAVSGNQIIVGVHLHAMQLEYPLTVLGAKQVVCGANMVFVKQRVI